MRKLTGIMVVALMVLLGTPVLAEQEFTCEIGYTGPDSQNMCKSEVVYRCEVKNQNDITIVNENDQEVFSGSVELSGNTNGGNATSGTATNTNGSTFNISIDNSTPDICVASLVVPANPVPEKPEKPVTPPVEQPEGRGEVKELPVTGTDSVLDNLGLIAGSSIAVAAVSLGGVLFYRYRNS